MLSLIKHPASLRQVGVHARVLHKVVNENVQTSQIRRFSCYHLKHGLGQLQHVQVQTLSSTLYSERLYMWIGWLSAATKISDFSGSTKIAKFSTHKQKSFISPIITKISTR